MSRQINIRFLRFMIIHGLAVFLFDKLASGKLSYYINARFFPLTGFAIFILWLMVFLGWLRLLKDLSMKNRISLLVIELVIFLTFLPLLVNLRGFSGWILAAAFLTGNAGMYLLMISMKRGSRSAMDHAGASVLPLAILTIPLLIGLLSNEQALSSAALSKRGLNTSTSLSGEQAASRSLEVIEDDRTILDWIKVFNYSDNPESYIGQEVNVTGFVYHDARLPEGQFMVSRFVITCCVADAFAIGMPMDAPEFAQMEDNTWINVKGKLDITAIDGDSAPMIRAGSIETISAPEQPYLYP